MYVFLTMLTLAVVKRGGGIVILVDSQPLVFSLMTISPHSQD